MDVRSCLCDVRDSGTVSVVLSTGRVVAGWTRGATSNAMPYYLGPHPPSYYSAPPHPVLPVLRGTVQRACYTMCSTEIGYAGTSESCGGSKGAME
eukprot:3194881-Rhodomonas_salina.2